MVGTKGAGWLHRLGDAPVKVPKVVSKREQNSPIDFNSLARKYHEMLDEKSLAMFSQSIGVSVDSLRRLRTGWDGEAYTFPMMDAKPQVVGIRRRFRDGRKLSVKGGHEGLFMATACLSHEGPVLICEGPTDTGAMLDIGFSAVGRPSCNGGTDILKALLNGRDVVVVADDDKPGQDGADRLSKELVGRRIVKVITPLRGKDARAWKPSRAEVEMCIRNVRPR